jgi:hypothetical protein
MPASFFEKQKNLWSEQTVYKQLGLSGSFAGKIRKSTKLFDDSAQGPFVEDREKETKLSLKLNLKKSDYMIVGVRIKIDGPTRNGETKVKVMEREPLKVSPGEGYFYDLALSDVEAIYGSQNSIDLTFSTNDATKNPIRIHKILIFIQSQSDFKFTDKMTRHVKEVMKNTEAKTKGTVQPSSVRAIKQELL